VTLQDLKRASLGSLTPALRMMVQTVQKVVRPAFNARANTITRTTSRLGLFMILALPVAPCTPIGPVPVETNLLVLSGLSALTYGGAKAITTAKVDAAMNPVPAVAGAVAPAPQPPAIDEADDPRGRRC
jgi:hypothetical protein